MNTNDNEEVMEYFPDDPLAGVSEISPDHFVDNISLLQKPSNSRGNRIKIRSTKTKEKSYQTCTICKLPFANRSLLNVHQKTLHHQQFECFVCHKSFNRKSNLVTHSRSHTNDKPFRCEYCSLSFTDKAMLLKHVIFHTGDTRNQCRQCKLVLSSQERLEKHKKTHYVSANFQCHMCGANGFKSKKNLASHMRMHAKVCVKKFNDSSLTAVNEDKESQFDCDICHKRFSRKSNFMAHVKRHNSISNQPKYDKVKTHLCCICGKLFSKTHLIRHLYIHNGERPFKCEYCGSDFTQRGGLMKHIEKHKRSN